MCRRRRRRRQRTSATTDEPQLVGRQLVSRPTLVCLSSLLARFSILRFETSHTSGQQASQPASLQADSTPAIQCLASCNYKSACDRPAPHMNKCARPLARPPDSPGQRRLPTQVLAATSFEAAQVPPAKPLAGRLCAGSKHTTTRQLDKSKRESGRPKAAERDRDLSGGLLGAQRPPPSQSCLLPVRLIVYACCCSGGGCERPAIKRGNLIRRRGEGDWPARRRKCVKI